MADVRSLLRNEQASRRITHPNLSYTKSGLPNCLACNLIIKSESLWEGHLRSANHKKNVQKAQNTELQDGNGNSSKKRKMSDETEDVRKKRKSTGVELEDVRNGEAQEPETRQELPGNNGEDDIAGAAAPDTRHQSSSPQPVTSEVLMTTDLLRPEAKAQIDEDEWAAFEREVVPLTHQIAPTQPTDYSSAIISAAPASAAEIAAETNAERQQRRDAEVEDEKAEEETRLAEEFEVMEGLEEKVKRLKEKREALRIGVGVEMRENDAGDVVRNTEEKPPDPDDEDDSDEIDEWGFALQ